MKRMVPAADAFSIRLVRGFGPTAVIADGLAAENSDSSGNSAAETSAAERSLGLVERSPGLVASRERSKLVGNTILVDSLHPDFQARVEP